MRSRHIGVAEICTIGLVEIIIGFPERSVRTDDGEFKQCVWRKGGRLEPDMVEKATKQAKLSVLIV